MSRYADHIRSMYRGGVGDRRAKAYARFWSSVFARVPIGVRWVTLEVPGRKSGRRLQFPLGMADANGTWYLGSMLGECNWVRNVRANSGRAKLLRAGWAVPVTLVDVPVEDRPALIKRYLQQVHGARPHISVDKDAPVEEFVAIAAATPIFRVEGLEPVSRS